MGFFPNRRRDVGKPERAFRVAFKGAEPVEVMARNHSAAKYVAAKVLFDHNAMSACWHRQVSVSVAKRPTLLTTAKAGERAA